MRKTLLATVVIAGLMAGCGSSSTPTTPAATPPAATTGSGTTGAASGGGQMAQTGAAGTMGPPTSGKYNATNTTVLSHINAALVKFFTAKGFTGVTSNCTGVSASSASCKVTGTKGGQTSSAVLTISVNQTTGLLRIVHVAA